ncbi:MAG: ATPase, T2SS/T4P/T4SS family, partial [Steroidobacteraceae bacterium]
MHLLVSSPGSGERRYALPPGRHWIGSAADCMVRIACEGVGARHAVLHVASDGAVRIVDLGHRCGLRVNGSRVVDSGPLGPRDAIAIGETELRLQRGSAVDRSPARDRESALVTATDPAGGHGLASGSPLAGVPSAVSAPPLDEPMLLAAQRVHRQLLQELDLRRRDVGGMTDPELRALTESLLRPIVAAEWPAGGSAAAAQQRERLLQFVLDEALGLGPLEPLLADDSVREIMINAHDEIFVERQGCIERVSSRFSGERALRGVVERIVAPLGRRIDEASPMVDARLPDGSRVNAIIPPLAIRGTAVTIRRFGARRLAASDLLERGTLDPPMLEFLRLCVLRRRNVIVCGGTGSGKTTLLNVLSSLIPRSERVVTIEDSAELAFDHPNLVALETRPRNVEGRGEVSIRDLVRNALRMRPDRIVVGECRGGETLDMLQAMNTGHEGSLSTVHANSPRELLSRLEVMVLMSGVDLPLAAIREQVAASVHVIVHQARLAGGERRITHITEVTGMVSGTIQTQDIFRFVPGEP